MNNKDELSLVGWLVLIGMFAGLGYWFALPIKPLTAVWPCVQVILKGIVFLMMVAYQIMLVVESDESDYENPLVIAVSVIGTVIVQLIAIFVLFASFDSAFKATGNLGNLILCIYGIVIWLAIFAYGILSLALIITLIYAAGYGLIWVLAHPSQVTVPFAKMLFKQPKQEKQDEPIKKIYL